MPLTPPIFIDELDPLYRLKPYRRYMAYTDINISSEKLKELNISTIISGNISDIDEEFTFIEAAPAWGYYYSIYYGSQLIYFSIDAPEMEGDTVKLRFDDETLLPTPDNDALYYDENFVCYYDNLHQYPIKRTSAFGTELIYNRLYGVNPPALSLNISAYLNNPDQAFTGSLNTITRKKINIVSQNRSFIQLDDIGNNHRITEVGEITEVVPTIPGTIYNVYASEHILHKVNYGAFGENWKYEDLTSYNWWFLKQRQLYTGAGSGAHGNTNDTGSNLKIKLLCAHHSRFDFEEIKDYNK
jgi:hypothetical protein